MNPKTPAEALSLVIGDLNIVQRRLEFIIDDLGGDGSPPFVAVGQFATEVRRLCWDVQLLRKEFLELGAVVAKRSPSAPQAPTTGGPKIIIDERAVELERENAILRAEINVLQEKLERILSS